MEDEDHVARPLPSDQAGRRDEEERESGRVGGDQLRGARGPEAQGNVEERDLLRGNPREGAHRRMDPALRKQAGLVEVPRIVRAPGNGADQGPKERRIGEDPRSQRQPGSSGSRCGLGIRHGARS